MQRLDLHAQTLYAELLQRVLSDVIASTVEKLGRSFTSKKIGRHTYWYLQHRDTAGMKQTYLGRESTELLQVIESARTTSRSLEPDIKRRKDLCSAIRAMGFPNWPRPLVSTLETLADAGVFHLGAILIGTPAYVTGITALGYRSEIATALTGDIDLQVGRFVDAAMPGAAAVDVSNALDRVKLGFFPVPGLDPRRPSTTFKVRDGDLMVQFLTADHSQNDRPILIPELATAAQPMPYMEFLSQEPMKAVLPFNAGILVNVPNPARLAWHKLIVAHNRGSHERTKSNKDVQQAADLLSALVDSDREALEEAFADAYGRGSNWEAKLVGGLSRLRSSRPDAFAHIEPVLRPHLSDQILSKLRQRTSS